MPKEQTILDVDIGNSALKYRCGERRGRLPHEPAKGAQFSVQLPAEFRQIDRVRVASVLSSEQDAAFAKAVQARWGCACEFAQSSAETAGVRNGYNAPATLGVDRWLAVIAGYHRRKGAALVVDLGTAVTLDYVDDSGQHLGGYIVPGTQLMRDALLSETAAVRFDDTALLHNLAPGRQTRDAVERGTLLALVQLITGELERFNQLCHHNNRSGSSVDSEGSPSVDQCSRLVLCGGGAEAVAPHLQHGFEWVPELVLDGLALAIP